MSEEYFFFITVAPVWRTWRRLRRRCDLRRKTRRQTTSRARRTRKPSVGSRRKAEYAEVGLTV